MGTNGTDIGADLMLEAEKFAIEGVDRSQDQVDTADNFLFGPLVDKIAFGIARSLVGAVKELEHHVANEARKAGEAVERRLDSLQIGSRELFRFVGEQGSANVAVQDQLHELTVAGANL